MTDIFNSNIDWGQFSHYKPCKWNGITKDIERYIILIQNTSIHENYPNGYVDPSSYLYKYKISPKINMLIQIQNCFVSLNMELRLYIISLFS